MQGWRVGTAWGSPLHRKLYLIGSIGQVICDILLAWSDVMSGLQTIPEDPDAEHHHCEMKVHGGGMGWQFRKARTLEELKGLAERQSLSRSAKDLPELEAAAAAAGSPPSGAPADGNPNQQRVMIRFESVRFDSVRFLG